jgi:hypothetical protein
VHVLEAKNRSKNWESLHINKKEEGIERNKDAQPNAAKRRESKKPTFSILMIFHTALEHKERLCPCVLFSILKLHFPIF